MKFLKNTILCLFFVSIFLMLNAQDKITFGYDAAGNRISRTIVFATPQPAPPAPAEDKDKEEKTVVHTEMLSKIELKIYPNPTEGLLKVEINNLPEDVKANIWLYDMSGRMINFFGDVADEISINISNQPAGIYLMRVVAGEQRTEWKIIKR